MGRISEAKEDEIHTNYRVSTTLDTFNKTDSEIFSKFRNYVINEYRGSTTLKKVIESKG